MTLYCTAHHVTATITDKERRFRLPPHGTVCALPLHPAPKPGELPFLDGGEPTKRVCKVVELGLDGQPTGGDG